MQLSLLLAIIAAITVSENAPTHPVSFAGARLTLAVMGIAAVLIFAAASSLTVSRALRDRRTAQDQHWWLQWFARLKWVHQALWLIVGGGILYALDWPQLVRYNWGFDGIVLLEDLLILAPVWVPLLLSWAAFYEVERTLQAAAHDATSPVRPLRRSGYVWLQARTHLGLCVLPVLTLLVFQDAVRLVNPAWEQQDHAWLIYLVPIAGLTLVFPQLLASIWKTTPLAQGALHQRLTRLGRSMGVRCRGFRVWHTEGQLLNAAVAGLLPSTRYVFLTDALLAHLEEDEVVAVLVHELGHIQRRHLLLRLLLLALPIWALAWLRVTHPQLEPFLNQLVADAGTTVATLQYLLLPALTIAYAILALGWYSRLLEHDADLCVCQWGHGPEFVGALWKLSDLCGTATRRSTWMHPSTDQRIQLVRQAIQDPKQVGRFRRRVDRFNLALLGVYLCLPFLLSLAV